MGLAFGKQPLPSRLCKTSTVKDTGSDRPSGRRGEVELARAIVDLKEKWTSRREKSAFLEQRSISKSSDHSTFVNTMASIQ